jgi:MFS family permease
MKKLPDIPTGFDRLHLKWDLIMEPLWDPNFRPIVINYFVWNVAIGIASAFFTPHMINNLHMNFTQIALYYGVFALIGFIFNKPWGIIIDKFGNKPVLSFCSFGIVLVPLLWLFPRADFLWIFIFEVTYSGILWTGFSLAIFNIPITSSPRDKRIIYLAMFSMTTGLGFFVASLFAGSIAEFFSFVHWQIGKQTIVNYHILFVLTAILRFVSALMTTRLNYPKDKEMPDMIQYMGSSVKKRLSASRQYIPGIMIKRERGQKESI